MQIITHSGRFYCDDVMSCSLLTILYPDANIVRTDNINANDGDIVVGIGHVYDHDKKQYDYHQIDFNDRYHINSPTIFSSFGLIWKHYGMELINKVDYKLKDINVVYDKFYNYFVLPIDCIANNVKNKNDKYVPYDISQIILNFNLIDDEYKNFIDIVKLSRAFIFSALEKIIQDQLKFEQNLDEFNFVFKNRIHNNILILNSEFDVMPYLNKYDVHNDIKFIIMYHSDDQWLILTNKKLFIPILPENECIKFTDGIICMNENGFSTKSCHSAVVIAEKSLEYYNSWTYFVKKLVTNLVTKFW